MQKNVKSSATSMTKSGGEVMINHKDCKISTGIHYGLTFGSGELDDMGYWEFPCYECAREWEKEFPQNYPCWPFSREYLEERKAVEKL